MEIKFLGMIFVLLGSFGIGIFYRIRYGNRLHNMQDCERALYFTGRNGIRAHAADGGMRGGFGKDWRYSWQFFCTDCKKA